MELLPDLTIYEIGNSKSIFLFLECLLRENYIWSPSSLFIAESFSLTPGQSTFESPQFVQQFEKRLIAFHHHWQQKTRAKCMHLLMRHDLQKQC